MLALVLTLAAADVAWADQSGRCPASAGRAAVEAAAADFDEVSIAVDIREVPSGLSATLRLETADGTEQRTLESPACDTLVEAAVLITQAAAHASVPPPPAEPEPEPDPDPEPELEPEPEAELEQPEPPREPDPPPAASPEPIPSTRRLSLQAALRASGFAAFGITPRWSGGGRIAVGAAAQHWQVEATGSVSGPSRTADTPGVRVWGWSAGLRGCGHLGPYGARVPLQPGACGGVEVGQLLGDSTGQSVVDRRQHVDTWAAASLGPSLRAFFLPNLAIVADVEAVAVLYRPGFTIAQQEVFRAAVVAPRLSLGLELRLGPR